MIRNQYNYLTPSGKDAKGKERRFKSNGTEITTLQAESQKDSYFPKQLAERLFRIKKIHQDIQTKTYNDRNSKPQQKHRLKHKSDLNLGSPTKRQEHAHANLSLCWVHMLECTFSDDAALD